MLLVIDVGNTNTVLGVYEGETLLHHWRVWTDREKTSDEYGILLRNLYDASDFSSREIKAIIIPVLIPGPTIGGVRPKYRSHSSMMVGVSGGTTEAMMIALISRDEKSLAS